MHVSFQCVVIKLQFFAIRLTPRTHCERSKRATANLIVIRHGSYHKRYPHHHRRPDHSKQESISCILGVVAVASKRHILRYVVAEAPVNCRMSAWTIADSC